ncbi:STM3941 family protein [Streptococcus marmotae]|uniref:STM3941 family protein n=1 Tax=Streptococcus marmotae TaxID=1825069 RepID=UPI00082ECCF5|nr:STM3941 family protein [Streptococcus marmotae]
MNQPIIVTSEKSRYVSLSVLSFVMTLLSNFCIFAYSNEWHLSVLSLVFTVFGLIGVVLFGWFFVCYTKCVFVKQLPPILVVDDKGITDKSSAISIGFIPWEDITYIRLKPHLNQTYISVTLTDNDKYLSKMNVFQKYSSKANLKMGFPLVNIVLMTSNQTPQQVYSAILHQYGDKFIQ